MVRITEKKYQCPVCKLDSRVETNHWGEVYITCKVCGNDHFYCVEPEGIEQLESRYGGTAEFHCYYLDISDPKQAKEYEEIVTRLKALEGYNLFAVPSGKRGYILHDNFKRNFDGKLIKLYAPKQFDNQFVSSAGRVFYWKEYIHVNSRIKQGHYLTNVNIH